jgi:propanediol dehydratase small subunit
MQTPARADPPYVPIRHTAWPTRKTPRWLLAAGLLMVVAAVLVGIAVHPSRSQRATDLNGFLADMKTDIQSCAGGVRESLNALHSIQAGTEHDVGTAIHIATYGSANCSPANNMLLDDLVGYQVQESLSSFHLERVVYGLVDWATPDALRVQADVADVLRTQGAARAAARAKLTADLRVLDNQRAYLDRIMLAAIRATGASGHPPPLPG